MRTTSSLKLAILPLLAATMVSAGCEADTTVPSLPIEQVIQTHAGPLDPGGTSTYLFTLNSASTAQLMLAGAMVDGPLRSVPVALRLGLATWDAAESKCKSIQEVDLEPRLTPALQRAVEPGTYCATVTDTGTLTEPVGVVLRITSPALVLTGATPGTHTWNSTITRGGRATRSIQVSTTGTVRVTLNSLSVDNNVEAGIGVGVIDTATGVCHVARTVFARPGGAPQLVAPIGAGVFCAVLYDHGSLTVADQQFQMTIEHP
jgi:hypothetical protein